MIPKIAIRGKEKHSNLVIEYLQKLGGHNTYHCEGNDTQGFYFIDDLERIRCSSDVPIGYRLIDNWCNKKEEIKYFLVYWPESQYFIGREDCYYINPMGNINLDQAMFVPEETYNKIMNNN